MELLTFIVCDDIRTEIGNKHTLVGTYDEHITFHVSPDKKNSWPKTIKLGFYIKVIINSNDIPHSIHFKVLDKNDSIISNINGTLSMKNNENNKNNILKLALVNSNIKFSEPGPIRFVLDFFNKENKLIESVCPDYTIHISEKSS